MDKTLFESISERVDSLVEANAGLIRENQSLRSEMRWVKRAGSAMLFLGVVLLVIAGAKPDDRSKILEAEAFLLRDRVGTEKGAFRLTPEGRVELQFLDNDGRPRVHLGLDKNGVGFFMSASASAKDKRGAIGMVVPSKDDSPSIAVAFTGKATRFITPGAVNDDRPAGRPNRKNDVPGEVPQPPELPAPPVPPRP